MSDQVKVFDATQLSQIVACDKDYYDEHHKDESYGNYTAFLVNTGTVEGEEDPISDFYYGERRITNLSIIKGDLPGEAPDAAQEGRFYLTTRLNESTGNYYVSNLYIYFNNKFVPLLSNGTFKEVTYDSDAGVLNVTLGDETKVKLYAGGSIPNEMKQDIITSVVSQLLSDSSVGLTWGSF